WPNLVLVHLPVHASWLNQIEIYFSILQRKLLTPNDVADLAALEREILAFERRYQQIAEPFAWKFTRADPDRLLARVAAEQARSGAPGSVERVISGEERFAPLAQRRAGARRQRRRPDPGEAGDALGQPPVPAPERTPSRSARAAPGR